MPAPFTDLIGRGDAALGDLLERATRQHHRRRLGRAGWSRAFEGADPTWAGGGPAPTDGNRVEVHIDGASALPAMTAAVRGARSSVHVAGWAFSPSLIMDRDGTATSLRALLAEAAERVDVRVLSWAGAPVPLFHPTRAEARRSLQELVAGTRIRSALDRRNRPMHCHHEKLLIVDGGAAFVGGIDLTHRAGDRFDSAPHPSRRSLGWHDVAAFIEGPAVADVSAHFAMRWWETTGERILVAPTPEAAGSTRVQVVRTVPEHTYRSLPDGEFTVLEAYVGALRSAQRLIYLENQFLWSAEIVALLCQKLSRPPTDEFRVAVILPMQPNNGSEDTQGQLGVLRDADRHHRLLVGTVGAARPDGVSVYVHAKVAVVDDRWITVGSANLNEHSLFNDTEMNIVSDSQCLARGVRERLWSEHIAADCTGLDPLEVLETRWRPLLSETATSTVPLRCLPSRSRRATRLFGALNGLLVDG
jgi:phosphatidylserine/phosphatidylglycerophosphate/cardiolipin synthase-like enzyme